EGGGVWAGEGGIRGQAEGGHPGQADLAADREQSAAEEARVRRRNILLKTSRGDRASRQRTPQQFSRSRAMSSNLPSINRIAEIMGGDVASGEVVVPGPGHSAEDRSLAIKLDNAAP